MNSPVIFLRQFLIERLTPDPLIVSKPPGFAEDDQPGAAGGVQIMGVPSPTSRNMSLSTKRVYLFTYADPNSRNPHRDALVLMYRIKDLCHGERGVRYGHTVENPAGGHWFAKWIAFEQEPIQDNDENGVACAFAPLSIRM